jgi:hypothetical protein
MAKNALKLSKMAFHFGGNCLGLALPNTSCEVGRRLLHHIYGKAVEKNGGFRR